MSSSSTLSTKIVIASFARTPITKFCGSLSTFKGSELGSLAIRGAMNKIRQRSLDATTGSADDDHADAASATSRSLPTIPIREAYIGNVISAGMGQAPARQAVIGAGLPSTTICTTVNKVCASGMKAVMLATQSLQCASSSAINANATNNSNNKNGKLLGYAMLAGGFESMSQVPHYIQNSRQGTTLGNSQLIDGVIHDGLWDVYNNQHMGMCAEKCAKDHNFTREEQDEYAIESYRRAQVAIESNLFINEIVPVEVPQKRGGNPVVVDKDEEPSNIKVDKIPTLKPAFDRTGSGTVTAANASSLNDGAAAMILMTEADAINAGIQPIARILGYGDAEQDPVNFTTSPSLAIPIAIENAGLSSINDIEYHEINEAFSVVALANMKLLNLKHNNVNVLGGAVSLGHPIGCSGIRIIGTLLSVLEHRNATIGCASICNGGGGASAIIIERL